MLKRIKIKFQIKVLRHIKKLYIRQLSIAKENYSVHKKFDNKIPAEIDQNNIDYFETNIMTLECIIEDIQYELIVQ